MDKEKRIKHLPDNVESLNFPIEVFFETFGSGDGIKEYLVSPTYFVNMAREYGLEIISNNELYERFNKKIFLKGSGLFSELYNNLEKDNFKSISKLKTKKDVETLRTMKKLKGFSDLFQYYIFINRADTQKNTYNSVQECKGDVSNEKGYSGALLRQTVFNVNNQEQIKDHVSLQREYHGTSSYSVNSTSTKKTSH